MLSWKKLTTLLHVLCFANLSTGHILRLHCLEYGDFSITKENYQLQGSLLDTFSGPSASKCEYQCLMHSKCKSINVKSDNTCQLNSQSDNDPRDNATVVSMSGWTYRSTNYSEKLIGELCKLDNPCHEEYTCRDTCTSSGYECFHGGLDCRSAFLNGAKTSGKYYFKNGASFFPTFCDLSHANEWWIVFQRRVDASVDFYLGWADYKRGFGDLNGNFWLGLDELHSLAPPGRNTKLRIDMRHIKNPTKLYFAEYDSFSVSNEADKYRLQVIGYSGTAGDSLAYHNGMTFSTKDSDYNGCAQSYSGAWWYNGCHRSNLNGLFPPGALLPLTGKHMSWYYLHDEHDGIIFSEMKLAFYIR